MVKKSFFEPKNQRKLNISRHVYFKKNFGFFFQKKIEGLGAFSQLQHDKFEHYFFPQKNNCILFFKGDYLLFLILY